MIYQYLYTDIFCFTLPKRGKRSYNKGIELSYDLLCDVNVKKAVTFGWRLFLYLCGDGYRGVVKIVADIAARMCILNPYLQEDTLTKTPGIVVIDELDLSLHPSWQKRILYGCKYCNTRKAQKIKAGADALVNGEQSPFILPVDEVGWLCCSVQSRIIMGKSIYK